MLLFALLARERERVLFCPAYFRASGIQHFLFSFCRAQVLWKYIFASFFVGFVAIFIACQAFCFSQFSSALPGCGRAYPWLLRNEMLPLAAIAFQIEHPLQATRAATLIRNRYNNYPSRGVCAFVCVADSGKILAINTQQINNNSKQQWEWPHVK